MNAPQFSHRLRDIRNEGFPILNRYWADRDYARQCRIEAEHQNALNNQAMDRRMIANGSRWPAHWTEQEKQEASERILK